MFEFLNNIEIVSPVNQPKQATNRKQEVNPTNGADLRLFADGRIFPSAALVAEFNLEYSPKDSTDGQGFDVFSTKDWEQFPKNVNQHAILIAAVDKVEAKVDLFSMTKYDGEGNPVKSVLDQGAATFGKDVLLPMLKDVYGVEIPEGENHIDLRIVREISLPETNNGIYYLPKRVTKGAKAGTVQPYRRENLNLHPLAVFTQETAVPQAVESDEIIIN